MSALRRWWLPLACAALVLGGVLLLVVYLTRRPQVRVGSKAFPESIILGEMVRLLAQDTGKRVGHSKALGDTSKPWNALLVGEIDAYVEYTGTLKQEVLADEKPRTDADLRAALAKRGLRMSRSLGFRNDYALGMKESRAAELGIRKISDLRNHPKLKLGLSSQFIDRADGWKGLKARYRLPFPTPRGMEHSLAYEALDRGSLDVIDLYTTDAQILRYGVRVLEDDRKYFPTYEAVLLYRADLEERFPEVVRSILRLEGTVDEKEMQKLNARAIVERVPEGQVAADFLAERLGVHVDPGVEGLPARLWRATREHLVLVVTSLVLAILIAVPLGIIAGRRPALGQGLLALVGVLQTFPALALLSILIVVLGSLPALPGVGRVPAIGAVPAIVALFVYSLLPIVRNTQAGLTGIAPQVRESAEALGLSSWARLWLVELPIASPTILAGVKTAAVVNVGFATLGGLIGAGGYGQAIVIGLNKNDYRLVLEGAIPAVVLALIVQGLFELAERRLVPRGLRLRPAE
jgi:osmoprotectant transport system permease protein